MCTAPLKRCHISLSTMPGTRSEPPCSTQQTKRIFGPKTLQLFIVVQKAVAQACLWQIRLRTSAADEQLNSEVTLFSHMSHVGAQPCSTTWLATRRKHASKIQFTCTFFGASFWNPKPSQKRCLPKWASVDLESLNKAEIAANSSPKEVPG